MPEIRTYEILIVSLMTIHRKRRQWNDKNEKSIMHARDTKASFRSK